MKVWYTFSVMWRDDIITPHTLVYDHDTVWKLRPADTYHRGQTRQAVELAGGELLFSNMRMCR